jgi:hypothetical protein
MTRVLGLDEFQRKLTDLANRAQSLSGTRNVPVTDLLTPEFVQACSRFQSAEELFEASGFVINTPEDFAAIPDAEWDTFISSNTSFSSWEAMLGDAGGAWAARQLGL